MAMLFAAQRQKMEHDQGSKGVDGNLLQQLLLAQLSKQRQQQQQQQQQQQGRCSAEDEVRVLAEPLLRAAEQQQQIQQQQKQKQKHIAEGSRNPTAASTPRANATGTWTAASSPSPSSATDDVKLKRRREQIAAASRKSRAKRKREMQDLQSANQQLREKVARLEVELRLRTQGGCGEAKPGSEDSSQEHDGALSPLSRKPSDRTDDNGSECSQSSGRRDRAESAGTSSSVDTHVADRLQSALEERPELKAVVDMVQERVQWLFDKTVEDAKTVHAQRLDPETLALVNNLTMKICLP